MKKNISPFGIRAQKIILGQDPDIEGAPDTDRIFTFNLGVDQELAGAVFETLSENIEMKDLDLRPEHPSSFRLATEEGNYVVKISSDLLGKARRSIQGIGRGEDGRD